MVALTLFVILSLDLPFSGDLRVTPLPWKTRYVSFRTLNRDVRVSVAARSGLIWHRSPPVQGLQGY